MKAQYKPFEKICKKMGSIGWLYKIFSCMPDTVGKVS